ncbi:MAG: class I SAM-dependent methyltransferase [Myxococcota bacterium]
MDREQQTVAMWTRGDYRIVGDWFTHASIRALDHLDLEPGVQLLDVACGTGAVAIAAAQRGARVTGVDLTPSMLEEAKRRAATAGVEVNWVRGSFEELEPLGAFGAVTSAFGVMFARDPQAVARELVSVCAPNGRISVVAWHEDGAFGSGSKLLAPWLTQLPKGPDTARWAHEESVREFFAGLPVQLIHSARHDLTLPFASLDTAFAELEEYSGPWNAILEYFKAMGTYDDAKGAVLDHLSAHASERDDGVKLRASYVVTTLQREP